MDESANEPWPRACLQVYTGDGKGKTTAAFGLAMRAAGRGMSAYVGQFMKGSVYGEVAAAAMLGGLVTVEQFGSPECIPWREEPEEEDVALARRGLERCREAMLSGRYRVVVLDEVCVAAFFGVVGEEDLLAIVDARPPGVEVVCTGRYAPRGLVERADLVTAMAEVKHPFAKDGLLARDGIER